MKINLLITCNGDGRIDLWLPSNDLESPRWDKTTGEWEGYEEHLGTLLSATSIEALGHVNIRSDIKPGEKSEIEIDV